jgi:hypothetical protein
LSTPNLLETKIDRVMVEISKEGCASVQGASLAVRSLPLIVRSMGLHHLITGHGAPESDLKALKTGNHKL